MPVRFVRCPSPNFGELGSLKDMKDKRFDIFCTIDEKDKE